MSDIWAACPPDSNAAIGRFIGDGVKVMNYLGTIMMAYLAMMAPRLVELYRSSKSTGYYGSITKADLTLFFGSTRVGARAYYANARKNL